MLRLLLLRHSKAAPHSASGDHERALIERGRVEAARLGRFIASQTPAPDRAVHSGARRAKETLSIVLTELTTNAPVATEPRLYEATARAFLAALRAQPDEAKTLLIVGHNPSMAEVALRLATQGEADALRRMAVKFPTSGLAIIDFDVAHWAKIAEGAGRLEAFVTPASLEGVDD